MENLSVTPSKSTSRIIEKESIYTYIGHYVNIVSNKDTAANVCPIG
jgi:hypothetical protein